MRRVLAFVVVLAIVNIGILIYQVWPESSDRAVPGRGFGSPEFLQRERDARIFEIEQKQLQFELEKAIEDANRFDWRR